MVGDALLVHPVSKSGSAHELVYFPGENQRWFDIYTHEEISHHGGINMPIVYEHIPGKWHFCTWHLANVQLYFDSHLKFFILVLNTSRK
jgi:hypothetical protein